MQISTHGSCSLYPWVEPIGGQRRMFLVLSTGNAPLNWIRFYSPPERGRIYGVVQVVGSRPRTGDRHCKVRFTGLTISEGDTVGEVRRRITQADGTCCGSRGSMQMVRSMSRHRPTPASSTRATRSGRCQFYFDITPDQIQTLRVAYRMHEVVEITNFAMKAGEGVGQPADDG